MSVVIELNDLNAVAEYRSAWQALWGQTPGATFFQTLDWLLIYWSHYGEGQKLRVLVVQADGEPIGIVPLCVRCESRRTGAVRVLTYPLDDWGSVFGPIGPNPLAALTLAMRHVASTPRDWDVLDLRWVAHPCEDRGHTSRALEAAGLTPSVTPRLPYSVVDLPVAWEEYLAGRSPKTRHEVRRLLRRAEESGRVQYLRYRPASRRDGGGDPRWDLYAMCEQVALASWQADVTDGNTLTHEAHRAFYRDAHAAAARLGMCDLNLLLIDGEPVAYLYNYVSNGRVFGLRTGTTPAGRERAAGLTLIISALRDGCRRGDKQVDMGVGDQAYKQRLRTRAAHAFSVSHTPLVSWRGQAARLAGWARRRVASA